MNQQTLELLAFYHVAMASCLERIAANNYPTQSGYTLQEDLNNLEFYATKLAETARGASK